MQPAWSLREVAVDAPSTDAYYRTVATWLREHRVAAGLSRCGRGCARTS